MFDLFEAFVRQTIPLAAIFLAVACFYRVGVVNVAGDGTIQVAAIVYAAVSVKVNPYLGLIVATSLGGMLGLGVTRAMTLRPRVEDVLFTIGLNYLLVGLSPMICWWTFGSPGSGFLMDRRVPIPVIIVCLALATAVVLWVLNGVRVLRLGSILGCSQFGPWKELSFAEAIEGGIIRQIHGALGGGLLGLSGVLLATIGGMYSSGISAQRGFLGLLVVVALWPRPTYAVLLAPVVALVSLVLQRSGHSHQLEPVVPLGLLALLAFRDFVRGERWPQGVGGEDQTIAVREEPDAGS